MVIVFVLRDIAFVFLGIVFVLHDIVFVFMDVVFVLPESPR